jgi:hypothetical protein
MASSSLDKSPARGGFHDLHSFKDFVAMVIVCAPDNFMSQDWRATDDQWNLDRAFAGLRYGLGLTSREKGESAILARCRELVEQSYVEYRAGRDHAGQLKLEEMEKLLKQIPSR